MLRKAARSCGRSPGSQCGEGVRGTSTPNFTPVVVPLASGNVPKMLSKLRFSGITYTTRLIGQRVSVAVTDLVAVGATTGSFRPPPVHAYRVAPASARPDVLRKRRREKDGDRSWSGRSYPDPRSIPASGSGGSCTASTLARPSRGPQGPSRLMGPRQWSRSEFTALSRRGSSLTCSVKRKTSNTGSVTPGLEDSVSGPRPYGNLLQRQPPSSCCVSS